uniref:Uncharacterized protein n=1 Tax=viral metagenome TaxID=1070528 RepID=A0A6C0J6P8_9ZZZZ
MIMKMNRNFVIGKTIDLALEKYKQHDKGNVIELKNPLNMSSSKLEKKIIIGVLSNKIKDRELTITESTYLLWLKRMYPDLLKYRYFSIAIKFTEIEKDQLIRYMEEYRNKKVNLSNIYRIFDFSI